MVGCSMLGMEPVKKGWSVRMSCACTLASHPAKQATRLGVVEYQPLGFQRGHTIVMG